ncbi:MAG: glyoxylate/hydroxypyruvate reductase A [Pseudomonadota bacterium]
MLNVQFAANPDHWPIYQPLLTDAFQTAGLAATLGTTLDPSVVDYMVFSPRGQIEEFERYTKLKAVLSLWAGVEQALPLVPKHIPLSRMVDFGLTQGMVEWVTGHVLRHHLGLDAHIHGLGGVWAEDVHPPLAQDRHVGILGMGALGQACGEALNALGFAVMGWSRTAKSHPTISCHHGSAGLDEMLARTEIAVLLLPDTQATQNTLNARTLALMPKGAVIINPGRGPLIDDDALLAALDTGHIAHATLDVFRQEPLPPEHPFWHYPSVTVTPHVASVTRPKTAAQTVVETIRLHEAGAPLRFKVDRSAGY